MRLVGGTRVTSLLILLVVGLIKVVSGEIVGSGDGNDCDSDPCENGGTCTAGDSEYTCACVEGFTGTNCETDIDDCSPNPCQNGGSCTDAVNGYTCSCAVPYTGTNCETYDSKCSSNPCQNFGTCVDIAGGYTCNCPTDIYNGTNCETMLDRRLYLYGLMHDDQTLASDAFKRCDYAKKFCISGAMKIPRMQVYNSQFTSMQITTNGYVTLGASYISRTPNMFVDMFSPTKKADIYKSGFAMFAPMWTDCNAKEGNVFYHVYDGSTAGLSDVAKARAQYTWTKAKADVKKFAGLAEFTPTWVMVVTWENTLPRISYDPENDKPNTFQLTIIYDAASWMTFLVFGYEKTGWDSFLTVRSNTVGYYVTQYGIDKKAVPWVSGKEASFTLADLKGNTNVIGRYFYQVASGSGGTVNYEQRCEDWYYSQNMFVINLQMALTSSCPCDRRQARFDRRWQWDRELARTGASMECYYQRFLSFTTATQYCCYDNFWGSLLTRSDGSGSHLYSFHPKFYRAMHQQEDLEPKKWCCSYTDNCHLYLAARPVDYCWNYNPPWFGWFFGDPHIRTLDGLSYTFNGLGEYVLLETQDGNFTMQGRTEKALNENGTEIAATIFSGFAAKDATSDTVHIQANASRTGLILYVGDEDITAWFNGATDGDDKPYDGVEVARKSAFSVDVSFASGFLMNIGLKAGQLDVSVGAPPEFTNKTKGLIGVLNNDTSDDLLPSNTSVPLNTSESEKNIFYQFGETWRVQEADSLFKYLDGSTYDTFNGRSFTPIFVDDIISAMTDTERQLANDTCKGNNVECIFDLAVTGKTEVAEATLEINEKNTRDAKTMANTSPKIIVNSVFNVTVDTEATLTVTTSDAEDDVVTLTLESTLPDDATFDAATGVFTWTPASADAVNITFGASDDKGGIAPTAFVTVNLCHCSEHGSCLFSELAEGQNRADTFRIVACECDDGYAGATCADDFDGCADNPCTAGTDCTDLTPAEQVAQGKTFVCTGCPDGFEKDAGICVDIDECLSTQHTCSSVQDCKNTPGSYKCLCKTGYRLGADDKCIDIDECVEKTSDCQQSCTNTAGSFTCSCYDGYTMDANTHTCKQDATLVDKCTAAALGCEHGCRYKDGSTTEVECFCPEGYTLGGTKNNKCIDINECTDGSHTCEHVCTNEDGSYRCSCNIGYMLNTDKRTCRPCLYGLYGVGCTQLCECVQPNAVCNPATGCECPPGYRGSKCEVNIDECVEDAPCDANSTTCVDTVGSFRCDCKAGFSKYNATSCSVTPPEKAPSKGTPVLLPIILGSVIGVVFLVLFVLVIILILKKIRKNRSTDSSADVSDTTRPIDGDWRRTDRMFWQGTGEGMRSLPRVNRVEYARMKANSKAMEPFTTDWSIFRNFSRQADQLHRQHEFPNRRQTFY